MFSRFSMWLNRNNAHDLDALMEGFQRSYTYADKSAKAVKLMEVLDVSGWLLPSMADIKYHSDYHCFRFKKDDSGQVKLTYKAWSTDKW